MISCSLNHALPEGVVPQLERVVENVFGYAPENAKKLIMEILLCVRKKELVGILKINFDHSIDLY